VVRKKKPVRTKARATAKKGAAKKAAAKKAAARKATARKATARKATARKATARKKKSLRAAKPARARRAVKKKAVAVRARKAAKTRLKRAKVVRGRVAKTRAAKAKPAKAKTARTRAVKPRGVKAKVVRKKGRAIKLPRKPKVARRKVGIERVTRSSRVAEQKAQAAEKKARAAEKAEKKLRKAAQAVESERPRRGSERPARGSERPARGSERPARGSERPARGSERPARGSERPARNSERPASGRTKGSNPPGRIGSSNDRRGALREPAPRVVALPLPILPPPRRATIEERSAIIEQRLNAQSEEFRARYIESFDMSWIYHDSALEGVVYTFEELRTALNGPAPPVSDSSLQPTYDDIRRHKEAIEFVRDYGGKKRLPITLDCIKKIYLILHPEEGDIKTVKYRKDIPQHRLYFHEYAPPDKIAYKVRQIVDWLNDPETRKTRNGVRIAARAHYDLLRVYPFPNDSGKVARLFMNMLLLRTGLPASIVHSTERQRYYEALKGSATTVLQMVQESVENALASVEKLLDEHETRKRAFVS
jgi:Fic family protein